MRRATLAICCGLAGITPGKADGFSSIVAHVHDQRVTADDLRALAAAGAHGNARAAQLLAWMLATGREIPQDRRLAFIWYLQSYVNGMSSSLRDARLVYSHLSRSEAYSLDAQIVDLARTGLVAHPESNSSGPSGSNPTEIRAMLRDEATKAHLVPALAEAVAYVESRFHAEAVSNKGARGVMQIMPATGLSLQTRPDDLFDARTNIHTGVQYLTRLLQQYGRIDKALAHYVGGTAAAASYPASSGEVQRYVQSVMSVAPEFEKLNGGPLPKGGFPSTATEVALIQRGGVARAAQRGAAHQHGVAILRGGAAE